MIEQQPMVTVQVSVEQAEAIVAARAGPGDGEKMDAVRKIVDEALDATLAYALREADELDRRAKTYRAALTGRTARAKQSRTALDDQRRPG